MSHNEVDLLYRLAVAFGLTAAIGVERELRQKSAGLRTHALVGTGAALFTLVSAYGFGDVVTKGLVVLDPSRVAAQIVSGIGFLGGGLIFVHRNSVRGLTTAAGVWLTAGVGMAAAAGLPLLALAATVIYMIVSYAFPLITRWLPTSGYLPSQLQVTYEDGRGVLRELVARSCQQGFTVADLHVRRHSQGDESPPSVTVQLEVRGRGSVTDLAGELDHVDGVVAVSAVGLDPAGAA